jgi:hypothetical protein
LLVSSDPNPVFQSGKPVSVEESKPPVVVPGSSVVPPGMVSPPGIVAPGFIIPPISVEDP